MASIYTTSVQINMASEYEFANRAWKSACKILFGGEIGELESFRDYLTRYTERYSSSTSAISGKKITVTSQMYCKGAKFISHDEVPEYAKMMEKSKLDINSIKDIDSIRQALGEKLLYTGNLITGNSSHIFESDMVSDSNFVYRSIEVYGSKYAAYSSMSRLDEYIFGTNWSGQSKFCIRTNENFDLARCFETLSCRISTDCFYCATMENCSECMFSFNGKNRRNLIGNLELPKDIYLKKKASLVEQIRAELSKKKDVISTIDILGGKNA